MNLPEWIEWSEIWKYVVGMLAWPAKTLIFAAWNRIMHDLPHISGTYKGEYRYRHKGGDVVDAQETIRIRKIGRWVSATTEMTSPMVKKIKGEIRGSYLFATVESATRKTLSGKGFILLRSLENGSELAGHMVWVDSKLKEIYSTPYVWRRLDKEEQE
jgi:hypothetical protein